MSLRLVLFSLSFWSACAAWCAEPSLRPAELETLKTYCFDCHAGGAKKGGVSLAGEDGIVDYQDRELWHRVLKNVRAGLMPPPDKKSQPTTEEREHLQQSILRDVLALDSANPDPGRPILRRLNRQEYRNTVQQLLGVDFPVHEELPTDDSGHGFDNIGEVLTVSPMLLEKYLAAAKTIVGKAVPRDGLIMPDQRLGEEHFREATRQEDGSYAVGEIRPYLPYRKNGVRQLEFTVAHAGKYRMVLAMEGRERYVEGQVDINQARVKVFLNGEMVHEQTQGAAGGREYRPEIAQELAAGSHTLRVELEPAGPLHPDLRDLGIALEYFHLHGPEDKAHWKPTPGYAKWFPKPIPESLEARQIYAAEIFQSFVAKAFRRPVEQDTIQKLVNLAQLTWQKPGENFESGVGRALEAVIASPRFLFLEEFTEEGAAERFPLLDEYSLATRLSYFLWSSPPDAELHRLAAEKRLRTNLAAQVDRMLAHEQGKMLVRNFVGQWLQARDIEGVPIDARFVLLRQEKPDPDMEWARKRFFELIRREATELSEEERAEMEKARGLFAKNREKFRHADFSGELRQDMRQETELYFHHVVSENRPVREFLQSDYTFLNERLARHYGIPGVQGAELRRVQLSADSPRGGLLTQGTVLAVTSNPTRTSPVKRGLFILDNILGTPPPPPPPDVPALDDFSRGRGFEGTLRQNLERHRADAKCAGCHARMDPLGLALENFNAMGGWREEERGLKIDPSGKLVSGEDVASPRQLKEILASKHLEAFYRCFTEKLLTYALGRGLTWSDEATLEQLLEKMRASDGRAKDLIHSIVATDAFQRRRARHP